MTLFSALRYGLSGLMLAACLAVTYPALAEMISFKAELKGGNEVPKNDSKGTGTLTATYDTASKKLTWKGEYSGLSGPATMAHFHSVQLPDPFSQVGDVTVIITPITSPYLPFCYLCGRDFVAGDSRNRDYVPPQSIFAPADREPLWLPAHTACN